MINKILDRVKRLILNSQLAEKKSTVGKPLQISQANVTLGRRKLSDFLLYSDFEDDTMYMVNGDEFLMGFGFAIGSHSLTNDTVAVSLENIYKNAPDDTVVQWMEIGRDNITPSVNSWYSRQSKYNKSGMLDKMNKYRAKMLLDSTKKPLHKGSNLYLRLIERYVFFTFHYKGQLDIEQDLSVFIETINAYKESVKGTLNGVHLNPTPMDRDSARRVISGLCNPHLSANELEVFNSDDGISNFNDSVCVKNTNIQVQDNGDICFDSGNDDTVRAVHMTLDKAPKHVHLSEMGFLTGDMMNRDVRINSPYCLYTTIHIPNAALAKESVEKTLGWLTKQSMSTSQGMKNLLPHIYQRRDDSKHFIEEVSNGQRPIRAYSGIVLYCKPSSATMEADQLRSNWSNKGFVISRERHIAFPAWQACLPWQYRYFWDKPREGLIRARLAKSINAASMSLVQGDWTGNCPKMKEDGDGQPFLYNNGIPLVSGRGNLSFIDIFESESNYNFCVIATSGAGKSFFANDMCRDIRSRDGLVFVFDMGGSYRDFCEIMNGTNLDFPITAAFSINHFWGIDTLKEFQETFPILYSSIIAMAFERGQPSDIEIKSIQNGLRDAWKKHKGELGVKEIYDVYVNSGNEILERIGAQIQNYAEGTQSGWFNGKPEVDLDNPFTILELNELQNDPALKTVVFTTIIALVTRKIYSADRGVPKLLLIDEAWSLLDDDRAGPFIEQAFRTIRKFFGAAGIITQSCADTDISTAAKAAFTNSAWRFFLMQKSSSVSYAKDNQLLKSDGSHIFDVMDTIKRRDNFSEVLVEHDGTYSPFRFFVDPYSAFMYSSKAQDNTKVKKIADKFGLDKDQAIEVAAGLKSPSDFDTHNNLVESDELATSE